MNFEPWPKIVRADKVHWIATEKVDGSNAQIAFEPLEHATLQQVIANVEIDGVPHTVQAGSRKRWVAPGADNFGFAGWVANNAQELADLLGPGRHFGEWWGLGIQRGYDLMERRLSLFNTKRHEEVDVVVGGVAVRPVPVLCVGFELGEVMREAHAILLDKGSLAEEGYPKPEGAMLYSPALDRYVKAPFDPEPKGQG